MKPKIFYLEKTWLLFSIIALIFFIIEFKGIFLNVPGDENVYYYMGKLISEGDLPYKDFFYAHPPLQLTITTLIHKIFGFKIFILKLIPLLSVIAASFFLFKTAKEKFGYKEAYLSQILFLFSYAVIFNSVYSFGMNLTLLIISTAFYYFYAKQKYFLSGMLFGLAGITRLYSLVPFAVLIIFLLFKNKKNFLRFLYGFSVVFVSINIFMLIIFGNNFLTDVYTYHLKKPPLENKQSVFFDFIKLNWAIVAASLLVFFVKKRNKLYEPIFISLAYIAFLILLSRIFEFYFIMLVFFLSIIAGYSIINIFNMVPRKLAISITSILLLLFLWNLAADISFLQKFSFSKFEAGEEMVLFINNRFNKNSIIFGDESIAPMLALMTDREIAFNFVDTNENIFLTKIEDIDKVIDKLRKEKIEIIVIRTTQGISQFQPLLLFLQNECDLKKITEDRIEGGFVIFDCKAT